MRIRIIAAVVAGAGALGLVAIILLAVAYDSAIANPPDDSDTSTLEIDKPAQTAPRQTLLPPSDDELAELNEHGALIEACMADAGFPQYVDANVWDPDYEPSQPWDADLTEVQAAAASLALWGNTGAGADYHWDDAGCAGYATHVMGLDNAN